jgi:hypothetical protein
MNTEQKQEHRVSVVAIFGEFFRILLTGFGLPIRRERDGV